jgi:uncharacterized membrane protein
VPKNTAMPVAILILLGVATYSLMLRPHLPATIPIHWNIHGQVDGYGPRDLSLWLMPGFMVCLLAIWAAIPWFSPATFQAEDFRQAWDWVWLDTMGLLAFCHLVILQATMHPTIDIGKIMISGMGAFFALMGPPIAKVRRNRWMGYRTPWTLASDKVWASTHRFASKTMIVVGLGGAVAVWVGVPMTVCIIVVIGGMLVPAVQSAVVYRKLKARGEL